MDDQGRSRAGGHSAGRGSTGVSRRSIVAAGGAAGAAWLATGCAAGRAGQGAEGGQTPRAPSAQPVRITWQLRGDDTMTQAARWGAEQLRAKLPHVTIDFLPDGGLVEKTLTLMVAGEGPDVFPGWGHVLWQFAAKGQMVNHSDLVKDLRKADVDDLFDFQWKSLVIPNTGFRTGIPRFVNLVVLYVNASAFRQRGQALPAPDLSLDAYAALLKRMTYQEAERPVWGGHVLASNFEWFQRYPLIFGGHVVDPKDSTKTALADAGAQRGLEWLHARYWQDRSLAPLDSRLQPWQPTGRVGGFISGSMATAEEGMNSFRRIATEATQFEWDITHVPRGPSRRAAFGSNDAWSMWKGTKAKDASWELMKFLLSKEWLEQQARVQGLIPTRKSALETWTKTVREQLPGTQKVNLGVVSEALGAAEYLAVDETFLCQAEAGAVINPLLQEVFVRGERPPTAFRDARDQINQAAASCGIDPASTFK